MPKTALRTFAAALLLPALLAGCDAIYDDTKGWAKRLEASLLHAAHGETEPAAGAPAPAAAEAATRSGEMAPPPAVPVEPVTAVALAAPTAPASNPPEAPEGLMGAASEALLANEEAAPPPPKAKPEPAPMPLQAAEAPPAAAEADAAALVAAVLHLSSLRSEEAAKRQWHDLQARFPEPLVQLQAEFHRTDLGEQGTFYRVLAGPLPSRDEAAAVCAALKAKSAEQYCRILPRTSAEKPKVQALGRL